LENPVVFQIKQPKLQEKLNSGVLQLKNCSLYNLMIAFFSAAK